MVKDRILEMAKKTHQQIQIKIWLNLSCLNRSTDITGSDCVAIFIHYHVWFHTKELINLTLLTTKEIDIASLF